MASTKIQNLPLKAPIGAMKIPTGGFGDYSITVSSIGDFIIDAFNLATKDYVDNLLVEKEDRIDTTGGFLTPVSQNSNVPDTTNDVIDEVAQALLDRIEYVKDNFSAAPSHNELTGRSATGAHPSTSISHKSGTVYTYLQQSESDINNINNVSIPTINQTLLNKQDLIETGSALTPVAAQSPVPSVSHIGLNTAIQSLLNRTDFFSNHNNLTNRNDVNSHPASAIQDSSGQSQQQINNIQLLKNQQFLAFEDFNSVSDALNWVKQDIGNYIYAKAGKTYTLPSGNVFLNRVLCSNGTSTIIVPSDCNLTYLEKTDGSEIFELSNIIFKVLGHRANVINSSNNVYTTNPSTVIDKIKITNTYFYGLTNVSDINSWEDDSGMTRVQGIFSAKVKTSSYIENVNCYGIAFFAIIDCSNSNATHFESNVTCYNSETIFYFPVNTWKSGYSEKIRLINTSVQKSYWIKRDGSPALGRNGKNCIMCEADHELSYLIKNIYAKNAIEKSVYNTSKNSFTEDIIDDGSFSICTIKTPKLAGTPTYDAFGFNIISKNPSNTNGVQDTYGWNYVNLKKISIINSVKNITKPYTFTDLGTLIYEDIMAQNTGTPLYFTATSDVNLLKVKNAEFVDCYDSNLSTVFTKDAGSKFVNTIEFNSLNHYSQNISSINPTDIPTIGVICDGVVNFKSYNSNWFAKVSPFFKGTSTTYIEVLNNKFTLKNSTLLSSMWDNLKSTATYAPQANIFDFTIEFLTTNTSVPQPKINARFKKLNDNGVVLCSDYWSDINIDYPISIANGVSLITVGEKSFELTATFGQNMIKYYWDSVNKTITTLYNIGGKFSTTLTSDKINLYINTSDNRLIINIGNGAWTGGNGNLSIKLNRF